MEIYEKLLEKVESIRKDAELFYTKGNNSAGTRVRTALQEVKEIAQELRINVQESKKSK
jgi:hypothetical protein